MFHSTLPCFLYFIALIISWNYCVSSFVVLSPLEREYTGQVTTCTILTAVSPSPERVSGTQQGLVSV